MSVVKDEIIKNTLILKDILSDEKKLIKAAVTIQKGGLVVFPTETVYGLGADALNDRAVKSIFAAKGRPPDNPLIVHIAGVEDIETIAEIDIIALKLFRVFSPGPLTIIMKKKKLVPDIVTAGLDTVAVRIPSHPVARKIISACGRPVAAPSANISGRPSPTNFSMAFSEMNGKVDVIIDGGDCNIGIESTVISINGKTVNILRPGVITGEMIKKALSGKITVRTVYNNSEQSAPSSPGLKYSHYKPNADVYIVDDWEKAIKFAGSVQAGVLSLSKRHVISWKFQFKNF